MMKRGFLNTSKAYPKDKPVVPLRRRRATSIDKVSVKGYTPAPLDFISKDTNRKNYKDSDWIMATLPSTPNAIVDGQTVCLITGRAKRQILNTPGYPQPLPRPKQSDCFRIEEIPGKGRGLVATKDIKWGDLIFAERPMIIHPAALPANTVSAPAHFTGAQKQQVGLNESERQIGLLINELSPEDQAAFRDLWNCHKEDGSGPLLGASRTNGFGVSDYHEPIKPGFPEHAGSYSATWKIISRLNHSCRPNVGSGWDSPSFSMHVYAGRDIKKGEELCLNYLGDTLQLTASRQRDLRSYGFECICPACTNAASSDARCKEIEDVTKPRFITGSCPKTLLRQQKEMLDRAIILMEVEGLQLTEQYGGSLSKMSQLCVASQDREGARKYKRMHEMFCRATESTKSAVRDQKEADNKKLSEELQRLVKAMGYQSMK
ncbi:hypothetical protein VNI00_013406 [Paramarasmius palmivorus]|uniref:SET domain-containing protein n=1 Tax=Paramarasmius palmivorus TaxID=297713 RepID=A0AAW0C0Y4_9AGAR